MACGCKNKNNGNQTPQTQGAQTANNTQAQRPSPSIQESIKKVVEKYYNKKK
jgi:hypothetical protein